jgi:hypothetical protein
MKMNQLSSFGRLRTPLPSPMQRVCEDLELFGLNGFKQKTAEFRFRQEKVLNWKDRDRVYWIETGRHLPRPKGLRGMGTKTEKTETLKETKKRNAFKMSQKTFNKLVEFVEM